MGTASAACLLSLLGQLEGDLCGMCVSVGEDDKLRINLEYARKYDTKCFGTWTIPWRKSIHCGSRDLMERIIVRINRHMSSLTSGSEESFANRFDTFEAENLSIYRLPYTSGP